jgi:D-beta-D-heptose 7-phosphate kinase/D-beta-D-heptose 1-phosphate adenosyltransferase
MFQSLQSVVEALRGGLDGRRVLVVGDVMLDRYLWGRVSRISPEAPVPVLHLERETDVAGGAANVARNLAGLGVQVALAGVTGDDPARAVLLGLLAADGIDTADLAVAADRGTVTKTRVIGNHQQMIRIDAERAEPLAPGDRERLVAAVTTRLPDIDALLLSDYAKGVLGPETCRALIAAARTSRVPVLVDPKGRDFTRYTGATLITPNRGELALATGTDPQDRDGLLAAGARLREGLGLELLALTLSEQGMVLFSADGAREIPAVAREVFDVSGAGDTVIATFAAGLASGLDPLDTAHLANLAAGVVVGHVGTAPISRAELLSAICDEQALEQGAKVRDLAGTVEQVRRWRANGELVVFTNGCFDLLHVGHVTYLERARRYGHRLVVGLNTDASVRALKGPERPLIGEDDRARVLAALASVDAVVLFGEPTPIKLIEALRPDVLAKGADYREEDVVGAAEVKSWGGRVVLVPLVEDRSTSAIVRRVQGESLGESGALR